MSFSVFIVISLIIYLNAFGADSTIQKRQTQFEASIDTGGLLGIASGLQNLAGNILSKVKSQIKPIDFQFKSQFGNGYQYGQYGQNYPENDRPPYGPPGRPGFGRPDRPRHRPQGPDYRPPGFGPPGRHGWRPPLPPHGGPPGYPGQENQYPQGQNNFGQGNPGTVLGEDTNGNDETNNIAGYIDGNFPVILLDQENEVRR